jgi:hypothetical protein
MGLTTNPAPSIKTFFILVDFLCLPQPKGSEENQFTPPGVGVNKLIFKQLGISFPFKT